MDRFEFSCKILGDIVSICLGHSPKDGKKSKSEALWRVEEVIITEKNLGNRLEIYDLSAEIGKFISLIYILYNTIHYNTIQLHYIIFSSSCYLCLCNHLRQFHQPTSKRERHHI